MKHGLERETTGIGHSSIQFFLKLLNKPLPAEGTRMPAELGKGAARHMHRPALLP